MRNKGQVGGYKNKPALRTHDQAIGRVAVFGPIAIDDSAVVPLDFGELGAEQRAILIVNESDDYPVYWSHDETFTTAAGPRCRLAKNSSISIPLAAEHETLLYLICASGESVTISGACFA